MMLRTFCIAFALGLTLINSEATSQIKPDNNNTQKETAANHDSTQQNAPPDNLSTAIIGVERAIRDLIASEGEFADQKQLEIDQRNMALYRIERAIRDLVTAESENENQKQQEVDQRNLAAQEEVARWASWAATAAVLGAIATFIGLALIARTLHHTKLAAISTADMLVQAKRTAVAAENTISENREIGRKQVRANMSYVGFETKDIRHYDTPADTVFILHFKNSGASPAREVIFQVLLQNELHFPREIIHGRDLKPPTFEDFDATKVRGNTTYFCGANQIVKTLECAITKKEVIDRKKTLPRTFLYFAGWVRYKDDFWESDKDYRYLKFCLRLDSAVDNERFLSSPPCDEIFKLVEHGPDNFGT